MTGLRMKFTCGVLVLLSGSMAIGQAPAHELGDFGHYIPGLTMGVPLGAVPPDGLYFYNTTIYYPGFAGTGQNSAVTAKALLEVPVIYWATGWPFLGAKVLMAASKAPYELTIYPSAAAGPPFAGATVYPVMENTWVNPLTLSWNLKKDWYASAGFAFFIPDGSRYDNSSNPDYWSYELHGAVSYLGDGWDLTAHWVYEFNTPSAGHTGVFARTPFAAFGVGYRSGDQMFLDLTATKMFGKWELGPVAFFKLQTTSDRPGGGVSCAAMPALTGSLLKCGQAAEADLGGLIGYHFDRTTSLQMMVTDTVSSRDYFHGLNVWTKLAFQLWQPERQPDPPVSKPPVRKR
jgi:hypothetical protein